MRESEFDQVQDQINGFWPSYMNEHRASALWAALRRFEFGAITAAIQHEYVSKHRKEPHIPSLVDECVKQNTAVMQAKRHAACRTLVGIEDEVLGLLDGGSLHDPARQAEVAELVRIALPEDADGADTRTLLQLSLCGISRWKRYPEYAPGPTDDGSQGGMEPPQAEAPAGLFNEGA